MKRILALVGRTIRDYFRHETTTHEGRLNFTLMLISLLLALLLSVPPWLDAVVRVFRPENDVGSDLPLILGFFLFFNIMCVVVVGMLGQARRR